MTAADRPSLLETAAALVRADLDAFHAALADEGLTDTPAPGPVSS